jgi:hypothetical protein
MVLGPWSTEGSLLLGVVALGASCGLRIFLAPFVACLLALLGATEHGPQIASSPWAALGVTGLVLIEVALDKLRGFDQALDAAGLVLRPAWAAAIVVGFAPPELAIAPALLAGALALLVGTAKTRLRLEAGRDAVTWRGPALSLVEDAVSAGLVALALVAPTPAILGWCAVGLVGHLAASVVARRRWRLLAT